MNPKNNGLNDVSPPGRDMDDEVFRYNYNHGKGADYNDRFSVGKDDFRDDAEAESAASDYDFPGQPPSDENILEEARENLKAQFGELENVHITEVNNGVVTLEGTIKDASKLDLYAEIISHIEDVQGVLNNITVTPDDKLESRKA